MCSVKELVERLTEHAHYPDVLVMRQIGSIATTAMQAVDLIQAQEREIERLTAEKRYRWRRNMRMKADARWAKAEAKLAKVRDWAEWEVDDTDRVHDDTDCDRFKRAQLDVLAILDKEER